MSEATQPDVIYVRGRQWLRLAYEDHLRGRRAIAQFVQGCRQSDLEAVSNAIPDVDQALDGWRIAMQRARRLPGTTQAFRRAFLHVWIVSGDHIRQEASGDLILADALRILLPAYRGRRPVILYRGEAAHNWRYRPSLSWTTNVAVADAHARGIHSYSKGGAVLLKATMPPGAIISKVPANDDRYGETEYLVDRWMLETVRVVRRHAARQHGDST